MGNVDWGRAVVDGHGTDAHQRGDRSTADPAWEGDAKSKVIRLA